jgi:hypothetical protein
LEHDPFRTQLNAIKVGAHSPTKIPHRSACASASTERIPASAITSNWEPAMLGETNQRKIERGIETSPRKRHTFDRFILTPVRARLVNPA